MFTKIRPDKKGYRLVTRVTDIEMGSYSEYQLANVGSRYHSYMDGNGSRRLLVEV